MEQLCTNERRLRDHIRGCLALHAREGQLTESLVERHVDTLKGILSEREISDCQLGNLASSQRASGADQNTILIGVITHQPVTADLTEESIGDIYFEDCTGAAPVEIAICDPLYIGALVVACDFEVVVTPQCTLKPTSPVDYFRPLACCGSEVSVWVDASHSADASDFTYLEVTDLAIIATCEDVLDYHGMSLTDVYRPLAVVDASVAESRIILNVVGMVSAVSPIIQMQHRTFFFVEIRSYQVNDPPLQPRMRCAECPRSIVLFEGGDRVHWRSFLHIGAVCLITCLQRKRLYDLPVLEAQSAKELFSQRTGTVVFSGLLYPALESYEPFVSGRHGPHACPPQECLSHSEVPTVSYTGQISPSESMSHGIYALDQGKLYLFMTHQDTTTYGRGFRVGAEVKVYNAHPLFDTTSQDSRTLVGLVCCSYSSVAVSLYSDTADAPFVPTLQLRKAFAAFPMITSLRDYLWAFRASLVLSVKFQGIFRVKGGSFEGLRIPMTDDEPCFSADVIATNDIRRVIDWFVRLPTSTRNRLLGLANKLLKALTVTTRDAMVSTDAITADSHDYDSDEAGTGKTVEHTSRARKIYNEFVHHNTRGACTIMRQSTTPMPSIRFIREICSVRVLSERALVDISYPDGQSGRHRVYSSDQIFNTLEEASLANGYERKENSVLVCYLRYSTSLRCLKMSDCDKDAIDIIIPGLAPESLRCLFALKKFFLVIEELPENSQGVSEVMKYIYATKEDVLQLTKSGKRKTANPSTSLSITDRGKTEASSGNRTPIDAEIMILNKHETSKVLGACESYATAVVLHSNTTKIGMSAITGGGRGRTLSLDRLGSTNPQGTVQLTLLGKGAENFPFLRRGTRYRIANARRNAIMPGGDSWVVDDLTFVESSAGEIGNSETEQEGELVRSALDTLYEVRNLLNASMRLSDFISVRGIVKERIFVAEEDPGETSETVKIRLADTTNSLEVMDIYIPLQAGHKKLVMGLIPGATLCFERVHVRVSRKGNMYAHFKALSNITVQALPVATTNLSKENEHSGMADQDAQKGALHYDVDRRTGVVSLLPDVQHDVSTGEYDKWTLKDFLVPPDTVASLNNPGKDQHTNRANKAGHVQNRPHLVWCFISSIQLIRFTHACVRCGQVMRTSCLVCQENFPARAGDKGLLRCTARVMVEDGTAEAMVLLDNTHHIFDHVLRLNTAQRLEILNLTRRRGSLELFARDLNTHPTEVHRANSEAHFWNGREYAKEARAILGDLRQIHRHLTMLCVLVSSPRDITEKHNSATADVVPYDVLLCDGAEDSMGKDSGSETDPQMTYNLKKIYIAKDVYIDTRKAAQLILRPLGMHQTSATDELRKIMNNLASSSFDPS